MNDKVALPVPSSAGDVAAAIAVTSVLGVVVVLVLVLPLMVSLLSLSPVQNIAVQRDRRAHRLDKSSEFSNSPMYEVWPTAIFKPFGQPGHQEEQGKRLPACSFFDPRCPYCTKLESDTLGKQTRNALARAVLIHRLGEMRDRGLNLVTGASFFGVRCFWSGRHRFCAVLAAARRQDAAIRVLVGLAAYQPDRILHLEDEQGGR